MASGDELRIDPDRLARLAGPLLDGYVEAGRLPWTGLRVVQHDEVVFDDWRGTGDLETGRPIDPSAVFAIFSMTKPIVSAALLTLIEEGRVLLENPVSRWVPELADVAVWAGGSAEAPITEPLATPITVRHVLTHTAGFTNGFHYSHPVDEMYRARSITDLFGPKPTHTLADEMKLLAEVPLIRQPGVGYLYSCATDVVGRILEVECGKPLSEVLAERIFEPLGMVDTGFWVPPERADRLVPAYVRDKSRKLRRLGLKAFEAGRPHPMTVEPPVFESGTGGLFSTMDDYQRFTDALRRGGANDSGRILGDMTVALMGTNHLPGNGTMAAGGADGYVESSRDDNGFGLGVAVRPQRAGEYISEPGEMSWGGAASTLFWVDRANDVSVVFGTQLLPSATYPLNSQIRAVVNASLVSS